MVSQIKLLFFAALATPGCFAFIGWPHRTCKTDLAMADSNNESSRRSLLKVLTAPAMISLLGMPAFPREAVAKDELFKKNPLTNPLLEQIRIWEQAEADDIKYGGELTPGDAGNKGRVDQYPKLLVPILKMSDELKSVETLVHGNKDEDWPRALAILQQPQFEKINFKRIFNSFADNVYYSDPDRANAYLGGGAVPKSEQSLLYLLRNEILTNIDGLTVRQALLRLVFCI